ncbi:non-homologous end-joining DNA ligase [Paenibacillus tarimensis]
MSHFVFRIEGIDIEITNPDKLLWPEAGITKKEYINYLLLVAPYMLPYCRNRMLMIWRYPHGIRGERIEERSIHGTAPSWVPRVTYKDKERILLNNAATLIWVANKEALELHVPFDRYHRKEYPTELVFDLDPPNDRSFQLVLEAALKVKDVLDSLALYSIPKTSGATGLQIYVPIEPKYTFEETRVLNKFIADYIHQQMPDRITLDRVFERRGQKLYFDYLQLWRGRTMSAPYSVRARPLATVSVPVTWEEVMTGFSPTDFSVKNVPSRIEKVGDLFQRVSKEADRPNQNLDQILTFIRANK